jgi:hypothetical protein
MPDQTLDELRRQIEQLHHTADLLALKVEENTATDAAHTERIAALERRLRIVVNRINQIIRRLNERRI